VSKIAEKEKQERAHARIREMAKQQGVEAIKSIEELQGDFWPQEESVDDFLAWVREIRQESRKQNLSER
jgi:allophanate hydrolase subunit 1